MPEFFDNVTCSLLSSFSDIGIISTSPSGERAPRFEICYTLFFANSDEIGSSAFFNRTGSQLRDVLWVITGNSPTLHEALLNIYNDVRDGSRGDTSRDYFRRIQSFHLYFCTMCTIGWNPYFAAITYRLERLIVCPPSPFLFSKRNLIATSNSSTERSKYYNTRPHAKRIFRRPQNTPKTGFEASRIMPSN